MKKKLIKTLICLTIAISTLGGFTVNVMADSTSLGSVEAMITAALQNKKFETFNLAYNEISKIQNESIRNKYLEQIAPLAKELYSGKVLDYCNRIKELGSTGSARVYDQIVSSLANEAFNDDTKNYLLTEVMSWGKKLTYTSDYVVATDAIIRDWSLYKRKDVVSSKVVNSAIQDTKKIIAKIVNNYSKEYAYEMLNELEKTLGYGQSSDNQTILQKYSDYNNLKVKLTAAEKSAYLGYILKGAGITGIPDGYFLTKDGESFANLFAITDYSDEYLDKLQENVASTISLVETNKIKRVVNLKYNTTGEDIDVTSQVIITDSPLTGGVTIIPASTILNDSKNKSELLYVKNGRIYLKATKAINENNITVNVQVKTATSSSGLVPIVVSIKQ